MPTAGYLGKIMIGSDTIGNTANVRLTNKKNMVDVTSLQDSAVKNFPTIQEWSLSFDLTAFDLSDSGQSALMSALTNNTKSTFKVYVDSTHYYSGDGYVESVDINVDAKDVVKASVTISPAGAMTYT
ncbi:hypothetical protein G4O51_11455 [Candidatus Bathyarchaeota archaeon A05DMB-2]|nr:hypothetical protein [Candidatus Bathyarchaeota archaeon A05DMB-2]